jgi:hypothetical protein
MTAAGARILSSSLSRNAGHRCVISGVGLLTWVLGTHLTVCSRAVCLSTSTSSRAGRSRIGRPATAVQNKSCGPRRVSAEARTVLTQAISFKSTFDVVLPADRMLQIQPGRVSRIDVRIDPDNDHATRPVVGPNPRQNDPSILGLPLRCRPPHRRTRQASPALPRVRAKITQRNRSSQSPGGRMRRGFAQTSVRR